MRLAIILFVFSSFFLFAGTQNSKSLWPGKYFHVNGQFELSIEQWDSDGLSVDIIKRNDLKSPPTGSFVAFIKGKNIAEYRDIREPNCNVLFKHSKTGITLFDHCGGDGKDAGFYRKQGN